MQIAAFALALAAWKYPGAGDYRELPRLNVACSGQGVAGRRDDWLSLANEDDRLRAGMERLYDLFQQAPHLGSLIDPRREEGDLYEAGYAELLPLLTTALAKHVGDAELLAVGVAAQGITTAADLLARQYTLVTTNVPFLGKKGKVADLVKDYLNIHYPLGKADLASSFVHRCIQLCHDGGSMAVVTPQSWLFQVSYRKLREEFLSQRKWNLIARLGPNAFETISGEVVNVALVIQTSSKPLANATITGIDVSRNKTPAEKDARLANREPTQMMSVSQADQLRNPDAAFVLSSSQDHRQLSESVQTPQGVKTGDDEKWLLYFWELARQEVGWEYCQSTVNASVAYGGCSLIIDWRTQGDGMVRPRKGNVAKGKFGVAVSQMGTLPVSIYLGHHFDSNVAPVVPLDPPLLPALYCYLGSRGYHDAVRAVDQALKVTNDTLSKVPFDLAYWQGVAAERYPNGLPEPHSDDPTQWLFKGDIATSTDPLQVAVARLLGYRWPDQPAGPDTVDQLAATNGIACLPGVRGEPPASERLLDMLRAGYGQSWSNAVLAKLLADAGCKAGNTLHDWLAISFCEQHGKRFHQRPFIWQIWDGCKDGFSCLVNYHRLNHKTLENLTYSYLWDWITAQTDQARAGKIGADLRLAAAQALQEKLKFILAGEPPYDIFVRWKPLSEQPIGWNPDLDDGVRMNIRPFVEAGVLRKNPNIKWTKDRGNEPQRDKAEFPWFWDGHTPKGDRVNDVHLTNAEKLAARAAKKGATL